MVSCTQHQGLVGCPGSRTEQWRKSHTDTFSQLQDSVSLTLDPSTTQPHNRLLPSSNKAATSESRDPRERRKQEATLKNTQDRCYSTSVLRESRSLPLWALWSSREEERCQIESQSKQPNFTKLGFTWVHANEYILWMPPEWGWRLAENKGSITDLLTVPLSSSVPKILGHGLRYRWQSSGLYILV